MQFANNTKLSMLFFIGIVFIIIVLFAFAIHTILANNTIGSDILIFYLAARSSFIDGTGPYSPENAILSQLYSTGKLAEPGEDYLYYNYPPYALISLIPFVYLPFDWVQAIWMSIGIIAIILSLFFSFPRSSRWLPILILGIYPVTFGLLMGNFVIPITIILIANIGYYFFYKQKTQRKMEVFFAILLAWATVKPQFSWLYIIFILLAALQQKNLRFIYAFFGSLVGFIAISFLIYPNWIEQWIYQINFFIQTNPSELQIIRLLKTFLPAKISGVLSIPLILLAVFWVSYAFYKWFQIKIKTLSVLIIIGWVSYLLYPGGVDYQQIVFVIPFAIWIFQWKPKTPWMLPIIAIFAIFFSWLEFVGARLLGVEFKLQGWFFFIYIFWACLLLTRIEKSPANEVTSLIANSPQ